MSPVDSNLDLDYGSFELLHSFKALDKIPVQEFKSTRTGLTVFIAEVEGPVVQGYFGVPTEAFDDDGLPHTLEHLISLGSEQYPYKGILDLLANRCMATGTGSWTSVDHTTYTMETAGSEGFLLLLPIFLDHLLYPLLTEEGFTTEVHHITGEGKDAGVIYCRMEGEENAGETRMNLIMKRTLYPGHCGYSSETGGIMKNLRESTSNEKVRSFHKEFYRPENVKIMIIGQVDPEDVFRALAPIENRILAKGERGPFTRPWQGPVPPLLESQDVVIRYPSDEETNGMVCVAWRGCSVITDPYTTTAFSIILKYLSDTSVSLLEKEFVQQDDPYATQISYGVMEYSESCMYLTFKYVPKAKLPLIKPKLDKVLQKIVDNEDIDLQRFKTIITRDKLEWLSSLESCPHSAVSCLLMQHILYGNGREDFEKRLNPITSWDTLMTEPKTFWLALLQKYFVDNKYVCIQAIPSIEKKHKIASKEKERVEAQISALGPERLKEKQEQLEDAIAINERLPPEELLTSVPIPGITSIKFSDIVRYSSTSEINEHIDLSATPVFTYFDHLSSTAFVYIHGLLDTSMLSIEQRLYLPLLLETLLESPMERDGQLILYEDVVTQLHEDTVLVYQTIGLNRCSHTVLIYVQVEPSKYALGVNWLKELLFKTKFTVERVKTVATKLINDGDELKCRQFYMVANLMNRLCYVPDSNQHAQGLFRQLKFLKQLVEKLESPDSASVILDTMENIRSILTDPSNVVIYLAANLDDLPLDVAKPINEFLPIELNAIGNQQILNVTPDWKLLDQTCNEGFSHCIVGMSCLEATFFSQTTHSITSYNDPDYPALLVFMQYLAQDEGPMRKRIRDKGCPYGYTITLIANEGLLYLEFHGATDVVSAYKETYDMVTEQLEAQIWDNNLLESAKSSLIYQIVRNETCIGDVVTHSLETYFHGVAYEHNRLLLGLINKVSIEDLNRVGSKYMARLFNPDKVKTVIVCNPAKLEEIVNGFKELGIDLKAYPSLEESFLNQ